MGKMFTKHKFDIAFFFDNFVKTVEKRPFFLLY